MLVAMKTLEKHRQATPKLALSRSEAAEALGVSTVTIVVAGLKTGRFDRFESRVLYGGS